MVGTEGESLPWALERQRRLREFVGVLIDSILSLSHVTEELGPYRVVRKIAVGGMAEIYLARQRGLEGLERTVVLKRILEKHANHAEFVTMFLDEARLMAALSHPNIAQVLDLRRDGSALYLVMEYVRGPTLHQLLGAARKSRQRLPDKPALGIALAVAEALHYVHECRDELGRSLGIVHRDLNPANVVVSYDGAVKLIDFGIAKAATQVYETRTGVVKGTYGYMAPEVLTGALSIDHRADVFALGILLYEILIGQHPFDVSNEPGLFDRIIEARYPRPRDVRPDLPSELDGLISRCLAPHPEGRPESVEQFVHELTAHMATHGIVPTQLDCAELARTLVPDEEGPIRLRRPSTSHAPPAATPQRARTDATRRLGPGRPPLDPVPPPSFVVARLLGGMGILAAGVLAFIMTRSSISDDATPPQEHPPVIETFVPPIREPASSPTLDAGSLDAGTPDSRNAPVKRRRFRRARR